MTPLELEQCVLLASDVTCPKSYEATAMLQAWSVDCGVLLTVITTTQHEQVLFYCLSTFLRSTTTTCTYEQRVSLRNYLLAGFPSKAPPHHLPTKAAVVLAHLIRVDFPHAWSTAFEELQQQAPPLVFFRTLVALQEEEDTREGADQIKDAMRGSLGVAPSQSITARLMDKLFAHVAAQQQNDSDDSILLLLLALQVLQKFASWIDLSLLVQDRVMTLVFGSLSSPNPKVGVAAMKTLQELVGRGMDNDRKLALLVETDMLRKLHQSVNLQVVDASPIEVVIEVAKLIDATGQELAPMMIMMIEQPHSTNNGRETLLLLWPQVMELFFRCLAFDDIDVSGAVLPLAGRLTTMQDDKTPASQLLAIMYRQMIYPADYQFDYYANDDEAEEEVYRGELRKLYQKLVRACPQTCLQFLCQALANLPVPLSSAGATELEAALRLVYHYCEGIRPPPGLKVVMKNETFRAVLVALQQSDITDHSHREVLLLYYDTSVRYYPIFLDQPELLPKVLESLSGERGLQHAHPHVSSRSCYLLLRLVKSVVKVMRPYVETAVTGIQG
jgi:exportin-T